jgi:hypothetical protein
LRILNNFENYKKAPQILARYSLGSMRTDPAIG